MIGPADILPGRSRANTEAEHLIISSLHYVDLVASAFKEGLSSSDIKLLILQQVRIR